MLVDNCKGMAARSRALSIQDATRECFWVLERKPDS